MNMVYKPVKVYSGTGVDELMNCIKANEEHMNAIEKEAIANGGLLHRFIYEPVADGKAIYQVIRVNKKTVNLRLCSLDGKYYDYVVPYWGDSPSVSRTYVENAISRQDAIRELMGKKPQST